MSSHGHDAKKDTGGSGAPGGITWYNTMQALFAPYVQCMKNPPGGYPIDLSSYDDVYNHRSAIEAALLSKAMPKGHANQQQWANEGGTAKFESWKTAGFPKGNPS